MRGAVPGGAYHSVDSAVRLFIWAFVLELRQFTVNPAKRAGYERAAALADRITAPL
jgi:hypothetical protein